jgi:hypothetical protein
MEVPGRREADLPNVEIDVEVRILDPVRKIEPERIVASFCVNGGSRWIRSEIRRQTSRIVSSPPGAPAGS